MIQITKKEKDAMLRRYPNAEIVSTTHKYYLVEKPYLLRHLYAMRNCPTLQSGLRS